MLSPGGNRNRLSHSQPQPVAPPRVRLRTGAWTVALLALLLACGCSTFQRDWRQAGRQPSLSDSLAGRWEGVWRSEVNDHDGKLRCLITFDDDTRCAARFRATYARVLRFSYTVRLEVRLEAGVWVFHGEEDLGRLAGGVFRYEGWASPTNFFATYNSEHDHGIFEMRRPE
jgi:hypothetical protein